MEKTPASLLKQDPIVPFLSCHGSALGHFVDPINNIVAAFQFCRHHQIKFFIIREIFSRS